MAKHLTIEDLRRMDGARLLKPAEVAAVFRVDPKTVSRWAQPDKKTGQVRLRSVRTAGGHRRFEVRLVLEAADQHR